MGRRKKEDTLKGITGVFNQKRQTENIQEEDNIVQICKEARKQHLTYGQYQAQRYSHLVDFKYKDEDKSSFKTTAEWQKVKNDSETITE